MVNQKSEHPILSVWRNPAKGMLLRLVPLFLAVIILISVLILISKNPGNSLYYFFTGPLISLRKASQFLEAAALLILTGGAVSIAFQSGSVNLGGEGQTYSGALTAAFFAITISALPAWLGVPLTLVAAALTGAAVGAVSGALKRFFSTNEFISTYLVSIILIILIDYLLAGPFRDPKSYLISSPSIPSHLQIGPLFSIPILPAVLLPAVLSALLLYFLLYRTTWGYELRLTGLNPVFAEYGGINIKAYMLYPLTVSGAIHGFAGGFTVLATYGACVQGGTAGLGWNGLAVALIARTNPLFVIPSALLFAYLEQGLDSAMLFSDVSFELSFLVQATVLFLITSTAFRKQGDT